ncbi:hypothetical protein Tco_0729466 [Tanacetum coccineum]|uniref:Uncharacterized protein n=1 Tax=Tanacetum coccineum TaxID=301880 RepID=A0ABQ4YRE7_9ASTR
MTANKISPDPDRTWVDGLLRFMELMGYGPTTLLLVELTGDEDLTDEDGDTGMGDLTGVSMSLGGEISSEGKESRESNIGDSDNTRDGGKTAGKITVVILVRDRCPHGKGPIRNFFEQMIAAIMGYRGGSGGRGLCCEVYGADVVVYGGRIGDVEVLCGGY